MSRPLNPIDVREQYRKTANLQSRIDLHARFSTNPYGWQRWVLDRMQLPAKARVLELGCGPGTLWLDNRHRLPADWEVLLSDRSAAMVQQALERLAPTDHPWRFLLADAAAVPVATYSVDAVIANHMLYHVGDVQNAVAGICRVLRPGGRLFAATIGHGHLTELQQSLARFDPSLAHWGQAIYERFDLDNGRFLLESWFDRVETHEYEDGLVVTQAQPLADYVLSTLSDASGLRPRLIQWFESELARCGGAMHISKRSGILIGVRR